jgi:hypothetical protein
MRIPITGIIITNINMADINITGLKSNICPKNSIINLINSGSAASE